MQVALAHDYLTQRGGAERVVLAMADAFPAAPIYTTLYEPKATFPEFVQCDVRASRLNRHGILRRSHRLALPYLARDIDRIHIDADVVLASSSGWAHGMRTDGRKIVYCHAPARWLYQTERYIGGAGAARGGALASARAGLTRAAVSALGGRLREWDAAAARSADRYLANSTVTQRAVREIYGIEADIVAPPPALIPDGPDEVVAGVEPGFVLVVARLLPYKNVDLVIEAVLARGDTRLIVVGSGPDRQRLDALAQSSPRVRLVGAVSDPQLRWLYRNCEALIAAAYEDYGLAPLEAASFGRPTVALRDGGFLDTVREGLSGVFFDSAGADAIADSVDRLRAQTWDSQAIATHADRFGAQRFAERLQAIVSEESGRT